VPTAGSIFLWPGVNSTLGRFAGLEAALGLFFDVRFELFVFFFCMVCLHIFFYITEESIHLHVRAVGVFVVLPVIVIVVSSGLRLG
jgi:Mn2+/Fe2+ NRAMP family transporter